MPFQIVSKLVFYIVPKWFGKWFFKHVQHVWAHVLTRVTLVHNTPRAEKQKACEALADWTRVNTCDTHGHMWHVWHVPRITDAAAEKHKQMVWNVYRHVTRVHKCDTCVHLWHVYICFRITCDMCHVWHVWTHVKRVDNERHVWTGGQMLPFQIVFQLVVQIDPKLLGKLLFQTRVTRVGTCCDTCDTCP